MVAGSRTENAAKNLKVAVICKLGLFGMAFVARTAFIRILGAEYTGVSSLYSNLLDILNLAEFGFGSVLTYELYKPLKEDDEEMIATLVALFKRIYLVVIAVVLGFGLLISTISKTQQQAMTATFFFFQPVILLSGFATPIETMPEVFQYITYLSPLRYFLIIVRGIFLKVVGSNG